MKRFVTNIVIFFVFVLVVDIFIGYCGDYMLSKATRGETNRTYSLTKVDQHDVLILGSSRARYHYNAEFLSDTLCLDVYNGGYEGRGVITAYGFLSMISERYRPQLILFDVNPDFDILVHEPDMNNKRYIGVLKPYWRDKNVGNTIRDVYAADWYKCHFGMLRYNTIILQMLVDFKGTKYEKNKGSVLLKGIYDWEPEITKIETRIDPLKLSYIDKFLQLAKDKRIPIIVVASPKYGQTSSKILQPVIDICKDKGIPFYDYWASEPFMSHKEWFNDPLHLNYKGTKIFNKLLVEDIKKLLNDND
jgi:hypothetical protein